MSHQPHPATPLVSIIVTNHNYRRYLAECLDSACSQDYTRCEVIVVDDGSTDDSRLVLDSYSRRVQVLYQPHLGQPAAYNRGFQLSQGAIVIFLDADDTLLPHALMQIVTAWQPGISKCHYRLVRVDENGRSLGLTVPPQSRSLPAGDLLPILRRVGRYCSPPGSGNAYARSYLEQVMPIALADRALVADGYVITLAPLFGAVAALDAVLGTYRVHSAGLSGSGALRAATFAVKTGNELCLQGLLARHLGDFSPDAAEARCRRDLLHLEHRLVSLRLVPHLHPCASDTRRRLLHDALVSVGQDPDVGRLERPLRRILFGALALLPHAVLRPLVGWRYIASRQPAALRRIWHWVTTSDRHHHPVEREAMVRP